MTTIRETKEQVRDLEHWSKGIPLEEQRLIECVKTVLHLTKLYIRDAAEKGIK